MVFYSILVFSLIVKRHQRTDAERFSEFLLHVIRYHIGSDLFYNTGIGHTIVCQQHITAAHIVHYDVARQICAEFSQKIFTLQTAHIYQFFYITLFFDLLFCDIDAAADYLIERRTPVSNPSQHDSQPQVIVLFVQKVDIRLSVFFSVDYHLV